MSEPLGELVPVGGGDSIPLLRTVMTIGRRRVNDICLDFANVSGQHCELILKNGVWHVRDLRSQNGTKVNGERVQQRIVKPNDLISISKHDFRIQYHLSQSAVDFLDQTADAPEDAFAQSLMEKAGLSKPRRSDDDD